MPETNDEKQKGVFIDVIKQYLRENAATLQRLGLSTKLSIRFGQAKTPLLGRLGIWLVNLSGGKMEMEFHARDKA